LRELQTVDAHLNHRAAVAARYAEVLDPAGAWLQCVPPYASHGYLRFPLVTMDRTAFTVAARAAGLIVGDWFRSPLDPVAPERLGAWGYTNGDAPVAEWVSARIVNLRTDRDLSPGEIDRTCEFLEHHGDAIARPADLPNPQAG
jgi:dTDP-4-amino-4,6-dideoxygalactose transaminase